MKQKVTEYPMVEPGELRAFLRGFIAFTVEVIRFTARAIRENVLLFSLTFALLGASSWYYWKNIPTYYEAEMVCAFNNLHKKTFGEMVHRLGVLAQSGSYQQLSQTLNITQKQAETLVNFEARNIAGSPLQDDITPEKLPMYFRVKTTDNSVFPAIQTALLRHLNNTPYRQKRQKLELARIEQKIANLDRSIEQIDAVVLAYRGALGNGRILRDSVAQFGDVVRLLNEKEVLQEKRLEETKSKELLNSVDLVYGFLPPDKPVVAGFGLLLKLLLASFGAAVGAVVLKKVLANG